MKRCLVLVAVLLAAIPLVAQRTSSRDRLRYNQMNEQGVWSVGVAMEPVVGMVHPLGKPLGGGCVTSMGFVGVGVEGGYFVVDNLRLSASLGVVGDSWAGVFRAKPYDGYHTLTQFRFRIGAYWHFARWDVGGGLAVGSSTLNYWAANTENGGIDNPRFGATDLKDSHTTLGLVYEAGCMVSPFLKLGAFWQPSIAFGGGYCHSIGARLTIYLPFVNSVVCK